jgi:hypothetical protein
MLSIRAATSTKASLPTIDESPIEDLADSQNPQGSGMFTNQASLSRRPLGKLYNEIHNGTLLHHANENMQLAEKGVY